MEYFCDNDQCPQHVAITDYEIFEHGLEIITKKHKRLKRHLYHKWDGKHVESVWLCDVCVNAHNTDVKKVIMDLKRTWVKEA